MKIQFIYSEIYYRMLNRRNKAGYDWLQVNQIGKEFEKEYSKEISKLPRIISRIINGKLNEDIKVYMVHWKGPSFSLPLTLNVKQDKLMMPVVLIHEILHYFVKGNIDKKKHEKINNTVEKVLKEMKINADDQIKLLKKWSER